jgi:hypothetical protein
MTVVIDGTTGVDTIQDNTVTSAKIVNGAVAAPDLAGNQSGSAPIFGARAWCVFNGTLTGTNAPTAGGNVTSVTRNSAGNYTVTLANALPDTNFAVTVSARLSGSAVMAAPAPDVSLTTTSVGAVTFNNAGASVDPTSVHLVIYR